MRYDLLRRSGTIYSDATVLFHPTQRYDFADVIKIIIDAYTTIEANTQLVAIERCKIEIGEDCMFFSEITCPFRR